jgi:predicted dehydrogenase
VLEKAVADAGGLDAITSVVVEWSERPEYALRERNYSPIQVSQLIISDSIHGIDLMLYLAGKCKDYKVLAIEKSRPFRWLMNISGISERKVLFNFHSSWDNPVPWRVVLHAHRKRYVFAPLETCLAFEEGKSEPRNLEPAWYDMELKAGFFVQSQLFLELMDGKPNPHDLDSATPAIQMSDRLMQAFDFSSRLLKNPV